MSRELWTDEKLTELRGVGDVLADATIDELFSQGGVDTVNSLIRALVVSDGLAPAALPDVITKYLEAMAAVPEVDPTKVRLGELFFEKLGPETLMTLGFYGLPADYAARKGVLVLHRTAMLSRSPIRRVFETMQMVIDVMTEGGPGPDGRGIRTAHRCGRASGRGPCRSDRYRSHAVCERPRPRRSWCGCRSCQVLSVPQAYCEPVALMLQKVSGPAAPRGYGYNQSDE